MVLPRVAGFILEIGATAPIPANDHAPRWKPPSTGSRPPSGHPPPAHERAARPLVRISREDVALARSRMLSVGLRRCCAEGTAHITVSRRPNRTGIDSRDVG